MFLVNPPTGPQRGSLLLAHGSGAPWNSLFMERAATVLAQQGLEVSRFQFEFAKSEKRRPPSPFAILQEEMRQVYRSWTARPPHFLGGKSLGGRVALSLAQELPVKGLLLLGYPFHPPGKLEKTRLQGFTALQLDTLILQGEKDPFGRPGEVIGYALPSCVQVNWLAGADHDFKISQRYPEVWPEVASRVQHWMANKDSALRNT